MRVEEMIRFAGLGLGIAVLPRSIAAAIDRRARRPRTVDIMLQPCRRWQVPAPPPDVATVAATAATREIHI